MGKVEEPKIGKLEVQEDETDLVSQLLEKIALPGDEAYRIMDAKLTEEIVEQLRGHYAEELVYNFPRTGGSKNTWKECDLMKGGCPYKGRTNHIHILGVGYLGALTAMRAYGRISAYVEDRPEVVEEADKLYWAAYAEVTDGHNGNSIGRWYMEPVLLTTRRGVIEKEFASSVAQSKALRNCILALIPHDLINQWIQDYRDGKKPFDPARTREMGYDKQTTNPQPKRRPKPKAQESPKQNTGQLDTLMGELASKRDLNLEIVGAWVELRESTVAQDTLFLHRLVNDDAQWSEAEAGYRKFEQSFLQAQKQAQEAEDLFQEGE